jgi:hypothetical protein
MSPTVFLSFVSAVGFSIVEASVEDVPGWRRRGRRGEVRVTPYPSTGGGSEVWSPTQEPQQHPYGPIWPASG